MALKLKQSTQRLLDRQGNEVPRAVLPPQEALDQATQKEQDRSTVLRHGCMLCTTKNIDRQVVAAAAPFDGTRIRCPYLVRTDEIELTPFQRKLAENCKVPEVYAEVMDGIEQEIDPDEIEELIPDFDAEPPDSVPAKAKPDPIPPPPPAEAPPGPLVPTVPQPEGVK